MPEKGEPTVHAVDARKLSPEGQADLRRRVVAAVEAGMTQMEAARVFGVSRRAVGVWVRAQRLYGPAALNPHRRGRQPGEQFALSRRQQSLLLMDISLAAPEAYGLDFPLWSRRALADFIESRFDLQLSGTTVGQYVTRWGLVGEGVRRIPGGLRPVMAADNRQAADPGAGLAARSTRGELFWVRWHRPTPTFVGMALIPGPGAVERGPQSGQIGPPPAHLDVLVAQSSRGAAYFLCINRPYAASSLRDFGARIARLAEEPVTLAVNQWPSDRGPLLRAWRSSAGRSVHVVF